MKTEHDVLGVVVSSNDIDIRLAVEAFAGVSWVPEQRGAAIRSEYVEHMLAVATRFQAVADTHPEKAPELSRALVDYRDGYLKRMNAWLSAKARVMSERISGGSKFDNRRAEAAWNRTNKHLGALGHYANTRADRILKRLTPKATREVKDTGLRGELAILEEKHALMKKVNAMIKKGAGIEDLVALGLDAKEAHMCVHGDGYGNFGFPSYELSSSNAKIKRIKAQLEALKQLGEMKPEQYEIGDVTVEEDPEADRIRLHFWDKPSAELRAKLKGAGFLWAPSEGAWQRRLTDAARQAARQVLEQ